MRSTGSEGKDVLAGRIRQINTGIHWPEEPVSRFEHMVTNVEVVAVDRDEIRVNSKFFCSSQQGKGDDALLFVRGYGEAPKHRDEDVGG